MEQQGIPMSIAVIIASAVIGAAFIAGMALMAILSA